MSFINGLDNYTGGNEKNNISTSKNIIKPEINGTSASGYESRRQTNFHKNYSAKD